MPITAEYTEDETTIKVEWNGQTLFVPDNMENRDRRKLAEWEANGGVIAPYVPPPKPTDDDLDAQEMEKVQLGSIDRAFFELLFEMANQIRVLQGKAELIRTQFANYAKTKLRS